MTTEFFRDHKLYETSKKTLALAQKLAEDYRDQGLSLTLRQLYYRLVAAGEIENSQAEYKKLGRVLTKARENGTFSWSILEDRGRNSHHPFVNENVLHAVGSIEYNYQLDRWAPLDHYVEVWVEKQALESVVERACQPLYTPYMACKGYLSASEAYAAGKRYAQKTAYSEKQGVLIHLGDHDPSGMHMTEDNRDRLQMFARDHGIQVVRVALTMDQIEEYSPPPNPAKESDSRAKWYMDQYGKSSWELDALEPSVLDGIIKGAVEPFIDREKWKEIYEREEEDRDPLAALGSNWHRVVELMQEDGII